MINPICKRALDTWGKKSQMLMVVEEMSELMKEILKNINRDRDNLAEIIEETADVEVMLEQLKACYNIEDDVETYKAKKILRLEQSLNDWDKKTA